MKRKFLRAGLVLTCVMAFASHAASAADVDWTPKKSWVFIVGLLEWKHPDFLPPFPKAGRRDSILAERFKERGVPAEQILLLQDKAATTAAVREDLKKFAEKAGEGDTLFLYFCGHGYKGDDGVDYFATYDAYNSAWAVSSIFDSVEANFHGKRAVLLADCCDSGVMASMAKARKGPLDYAVLTSVVGGDTSTANWTFSDALLDVIEGQPQADLNGDGVITFEEAQKYIQSEMRFFEEQNAASSRGGDLPATFKLALARPKTNQRIGEHVEVLYEGEWWRALVDDVKDGQVHVRYASPAKREEGWVADKDVRIFKIVAAPAAAVFAVGKKVQVEWHKRWWPAKVTKIDAAQKKYYITYDGYGSEWDEWVGTDRVRLRP